jgi:two-component system, LytTR family, response regulator
MRNLATAAPAAFEQLDIDRDLGRRELRLLVEERDRTIVVRPEEIEWIGAAANYVELNLPGASLLLRATLDSIERRLDPRQFLRVHRTAVVNVAAVAQIDRGAGFWELVLRSGKRQPVARSRQARVLAWLTGEPDAR